METVSSGRLEQFARGCSVNDALGCCGDARARIAAGLTLISLIGAVVIGSAVGGRLMAKLTHYKRIA